MASVDAFLRAEDAPPQGLVNGYLRRILVIAGKTRNALGTPLPFSNVHLFRTSDALNTSDGVSDSLGDYQFFVPTTTTYFVAAFKAYRIDADTGTADYSGLSADTTVREGVTANTLVGV